MKKRGYWKAAVLSSMIATAALSGCSGKNAQTQPKEENNKEAEFNYTGAAPVTDTPDAKVSILAQNSWYSTVDYANADIIKTIASNAGVTIDWTLVSPTNYKDSVSPMLASGADLPDIVELPDLDDNMTYITAGLFYPLDEYMN